MYVADWDGSDASGYKGCIGAPVACDTASMPQKPVNDMGVERTVLSGQNPPTAQKDLSYPDLEKPVWSVYPVRTTVVQPVGSEPLKPYVEKVTTKKDFESRKVAHICTANSKDTRTVTLRLAAGEVKAVEHQREIYADHVSISRWRDQEITVDSPTELYQSAVKEGPT